MGGKYTAWHGAPRLRAPPAGRSLKARSARSPAALILTPMTAGERRLGRLPRQCSMPRSEAELVPRAGKLAVEGSRAAGAYRAQVVHASRLRNLAESVVRFM
jgi:hypothetical protein